MKYYKISETLKSNIISTLQSAASDIHHPPLRVAVLDIVQAIHEAPPVAQEAASTKPVASPTKVPSL